MTEISYPARLSISIYQTTSNGVRIATYILNAPFFPINETTNEITKLKV